MGTHFPLKRSGKLWAFFSVCIQGRNSQQRFKFHDEKGDSRFWDVSKFCSKSESIFQCIFIKLKLIRWNKKFSNGITMQILLKILNFFDVRLNFLQGHGRNYGRKDKLKFKLFFLSFSARSFHVSGLKIALCYQGVPTSWGSKK